MNKDSILKLLKSVKPEADIPSTYGYIYDERVKNLTLVVKAKGLKANMQADEAAFESWAVVLKYYLKEYIDTITIDWERDILIDEDGHCHFNRFVYRLAKFVQTYSWVRSAKPIPAIPTLLYCNMGKKDAADISKHEPGSEGWLECKYVMDHAKEYDIMSHQFPVGIFKDRVSKNTHYTTGGKSAIDIWAIKNDCLTLFELKKPDNKPLGIISELLFYTNVIDDIMAHRIMYEPGKDTTYAIEHDVRGFQSFYNAYEKGSMKKIESVFLADNLHSLFSKELIDFINDAPRWKYKNISFIHKKVD